MYKYEYFHYTRKNKNISLEQLAKHLSISKSYLSLIEKGHRRLSYDLACKIAKFFETTPDELFLEDHNISLSQIESV